MQLATCVYAVFDPVARSLAYATAGHPPPVLRAPDGGTELLPQPSGAPLGVGGVPFEPATIDVADGSRLLRSTDGLVALDPLCDHLLVSLGRDGDHDDDVALLVAELARLDADRVATWRLDGGVEAVSEARAWVRATFTTWQVDSFAELAELLVSELVTNALRHARGPIELTALLLDEIVSRGLQLVSMLASRWWARPTVDGKVVWCDLVRPRP